MTIYACGMGKWVELRGATKAPRVLKTQLEIKVPYRDYWSGTTRHTSRKLNNVAIDGGKVLATLTVARFRASVGFAPTKGAVVELASSTVEQLKEGGFLK